METVAPHAGAWIETRISPRRRSSRPRSHPTRVRGLKLLKGPRGPFLELVAPHAGAWIETSATPRAPCSPRSHPHAGAWIETLSRRSTTRGQSGRTHAGAWIETLFASHAMSIPARSHPTRVRGLKLVLFLCFQPFGPSHPTRVRGLKLRTPDQQQQGTHVAPHAGAWIETSLDAA